MELLKMNNSNVTGLLGRQNSGNVLIIFAKRPRVGKVKTRIEKQTTGEFAYNFSMACIHDLFKNVRPDGKYDLLIVSDTRKDSIWFSKKFSVESIALETLKIDRGNMGIVFHQLFERLLTIMKKVILIPMDVPYIETSFLNKSFESLDIYNIILGPEFNGGVYLIGMKSPYMGNVFEKVRWSTRHTIYDLTANCKSTLLNMLPKMSDLNLVQDLFLMVNQIHKKCPMLSELIYTTEWGENFPEL